MKSDKELQQSFEKLRAVCAARYKFLSESKGAIKCQPMNDKKLSKLKQFVSEIVKQGLKL